MLKSPILALYKLAQPSLIARFQSTRLVQQNMGISVQEIVKSLQAFAPLTLAENWDNVGLLVDPMSNNIVNTILLTNDLTEDVVHEAKTLKAGLIVSYHPNIFQGLKTISAKTWKERIVVQCIRNEIAVFSPHTSWDSVEGGVNDWLASAFNSKAIKPIHEAVDNPRQGSGRLVNLGQVLSLENIVSLVKKHVGLERLRVAIARHKTSIDATVSTVALCAGSGASVLKGVQADLYLTGEMSHHDVLDATQNGIHVILCEHSNSERGFLKLFQNQLQTQILQNEVNVVVSEIDKDPLMIV